jgi:hypothetical protein
MPVHHVNSAFNEVIKMCHEVIFQHRHDVNRHNAAPQSQQLTTVETK